LGAVRRKTRDEIVRRGRGDLSESSLLEMVEESFLKKERKWASRRQLHCRGNIERKVAKQKQTFVLPCPCRRHRPKSGERLHRG